MPEETPETTWSLGRVYGRKELDGVLVHAAGSVCSVVAQAIVGLGPLLLSSVTAAAQQYARLRSLVLDDARIVLSQLPKGVGICTPQESSNVACGFDVPFFVTVDPLDGFAWLELASADELHGKGSGLFTCFSVVQGSDVIGAYAVDLVAGTLFRVCPQDLEQRVVLSEDRRGAEAVLLANEGAPISIAHSTLILQGLSPESHSELLSRFGALDFRRIEPNLKARVSNLLDVVRGNASAYFRPAGDSTSRWVELPLRMFARSSGIRRFELRDGALHEMSLADPPIEWTADAPDLFQGELQHGVLYVGGGYVNELSYLIPMHMLG